MQLLSVREIAEAFGTDAKTVRRWIWTGKLKHFKLGNIVRVKREWVEEFIAAHIH